MEQLGRERDRRYAARFTAIELATTTALTAQQAATASAFSAQQQAAAVAINEAKEWRTAANEWRGAMSDRERTFVSKESMSEGRRLGSAQLIGYIVGAAGVFIAIITILQKV